MTPRTTTLQLFTTFVQFTDDRFSGWAIDGRLRRNMIKTVQAIAPVITTDVDITVDESVEGRANGSGEQPLDHSERFWVTYWHQQWRACQLGQAAIEKSAGKSVGDGAEESAGEAVGTVAGEKANPQRNAPNPQVLPFNHLAAYLQEACYWVAQRSNVALLSQQFKLADYFQIAIAALPKIIQGFDPDYGASLKTYASLCFGNTIRDGLRRQKEAESRSNWGLLRKLSQKYFLEILHQAGYSAETIANYQLAWTCFKLYCAPIHESSEGSTTRRLADPDRATWQAIADFYNQQRLKQSPSPAAAMPAQIEQWLTQSAKHARQYLHPATQSLNVTGAERDDELQDQLSAALEDSPMVALMAQEQWQERQAQQAQLDQVMTAAIAQLSPKIQDLLTLYYVQQLTQQQIAAHLETKQYTVSRRLSSAKEALLLAITRWGEAELHIPLTSTAIKGISVLLEEWLEAHYQRAKRSSKETSS
jgi:RNA polymerase sigma factor (sigma-70 family)